MKKTIALFALVLCILAGLVSGSLALYTKDIENFADGSAIAKRFILTAARSEGYEDNVLIAPTETVKTAFTVSNNNGEYVTEVDMDLEITINIDAADGKEVIPYITAALFDPTKTTDNILGNVVENGNGEIKVTIDKAFAAHIAETKAFELRLYWESHDDDIRYQGPEYGIKYTVKVTGTQSV